MRSLVSLTNLPALSLPELISFRLGGLGIIGVIVGAPVVVGSRDWPTVSNTSLSSADSMASGWGVLHDIGVEPTDKQQVDATTTNASQLQRKS